MTGGLQPRRVKWLRRLWCWLARIVAAAASE